MPGPQPCHCRPFIFCIVGRGLDPSAGFALSHTPTGGYGILPYGAGAGRIYASPTCGTGEGAAERKVSGAVKTAPYMAPVNGES